MLRFKQKCFASMRSLSRFMEEMVPNPGTSDYWKNRVIDRYAAEPVAYRKLEKLLEQEEWPQTADGRFDEPPKAGAIKRIIVNTPNIENYRPARWPESFGNPDLPWEAASSYFDLWRYLKRQPSVRLTQAYWRVTLAFGKQSEMPANALHSLAAMFLFEGNWRFVEWCIRERETINVDGVPFLLGDIEKNLAMAEQVRGAMSDSELEELRQRLETLNDHWINRRWEESAAYLSRSQSLPNEWKGEEDLDD